MSESTSIDSQGKITIIPRGDDIDIILEGPGNTTVRPLAGKFLEAALKERERIAFWEKWYQENRPGIHPLIPVDVVLDGPGDMTERPLTGKRLEFALKMREYIAFWEKWTKENENNPNAEPPKDAPRHPLQQEPQP